MKAIITIILAASFLAITNAHTYHMGECPVVEPMHGFQMSKVRTFNYIYLFFNNSIDVYRTEVSLIFSSQKCVSFLVIFIFLILSIISRLIQNNNVIMDKRGSTHFSKLSSM